MAAGQRRTALERWLSQDLEAWLGGRVVPIDRTVAARWALLMAQGLRTRRPLPKIDSLMAATALVHDLTVVTRNIRDFETTFGVYAQSIGRIHSEEWIRLTLTFAHEKRQARGKCHHTTTMGRTMRLKTVRVTNFRSVEVSGEFTLDQVACLVEIQTASGLKAVPGDGL